MALNGTFSLWSKVKSRVLQGSILGPILFFLFVNDMSEVLNSLNLIMFADNSKYFKAIKSLCDSNACQNDLNAFFAWSISIFSHLSATIE